MVFSTKIKSDSPLVSVLMPAYNAENYIDEAIKSILKQTYKNFEFIILDDASTDNTWNILNDYVKKDNRIKIFKNPKNLYIAGARNKLIKLAKGKYIAWQDADDIAYPKRLEQQVNFLNSYPQVGIVGGFLDFFENGKVKSVRKYAEDDAVLRKRMFRYSPVAQPAAMIRKQCFDEVGGYNLKYPPAEDIDMSFRIGINWKFANIQNSILKYRITQTSATFKKLKHQFLSTLEVRNNYAKNDAYKRTFLDLIINGIQLTGVMILPTRFSVSLFIKFRNSKR